MKVEKNHYEINVKALYKEYKCQQINSTDPVLFIKLRINSLYDRIVHKNDYRLVQEIIDGSRYGAVIKRTSLKLRRDAILRMRRHSPLERKVLFEYNPYPQTFICILSKADKEYAYISITLDGEHVTNSKTLRILKSPYVPSVLKELSDQISTDLQPITSLSLLISLYGLLYPIYKIKDTLYLSVMVNREHYSAITFGKLLEQSVLLLSELTDIDPVKINVKTTLKSPGYYILYALSEIEQNWMAILCLFVLIFGGKYEAKGMSIESPSIKCFIMSILDHKHQKRLRELEVKEKELDLKIKEQEIELNRLKIEKEKNNIDETMDRIESITQNIKECAEDMNVEIPPEEVMDVCSIIAIINNQNEYKD